MSADLGTDFALLTGFDPLFPLASGPRLVLMAVYRRWTTDPRSVAGVRIYKSACRDIRQLLGSRGDAATDASWQQGLREVAKQDERVDDASALITRSNSGKVLTLRGLITVSGKVQTLVIPFSDLVPELILNG